MTDESRASENTLDSRLMEFKAAQTTAFRSITPSVADALTRTIIEKLSKTSSLEETTALARDFLRYLGDLTRGEVYGPYQFARPYMTTIEYEKSQKKLQRNILPPLQIRVSRDYQSFSSFVADISKQTGEAVDPLSERLGVSNNTLIGFLQNARRDPNQRPERKAKRNHVRIREKILSCITLTGEDTRYLHSLPYFLEDKAP